MEAPKVNAPRRHNYLAVIAGHVPGFRGDKGVYRGPFLHPFAKGHQPLGGFQFQGLDNIGAGFQAARGGPVSEFLKEGGGKMGGFQSRGCDTGAWKNPMYMGRSWFRVQPTSFPTPGAVSR